MPTRLSKCRTPSLSTADAATTGRWDTMGHATTSATFWLTTRWRGFAKNWKVQACTGDAFCCTPFAAVLALGWALASWRRCGIPSGSLPENVLRVRSAVSGAHIGGAGTRHGAPLMSVSVMPFVTGELPLQHYNRSTMLSNSARGIRCPALTSGSYFQRAVFVARAL